MRTKPRTAECAFTYNAAGKERIGMKVVVWRSPRALRGLLRLLFGFDRGED